MTTRQEQGRYARMIAFWSIAALMTYGIFHGGGLHSVLHRWMGSADSALVDPFPLFGNLRVSTLIAGAVLGLTLLVVHRVVNQRQISQILVDTEAEMLKVTWPGWNEVVQGSLAVTVMVLVVFVFLTCADVLMMQIMDLLFLGGRR
ncbi:MAG: preprotein translocase subunit SecE [Deltaproteobacteria bacterium]|nr:preprotein translocase subunit SecE [Deltaproteobacteria bacterium]